MPLISACYNAASPGVMHKNSHNFTVRLAAVVFLLALSACGTPVSHSASVLATAAPLSTPVMVTSTSEPTIVAASPTATEVPTATSTAVPAELDDAALQRQVDDLAAKFLAQGTNPGLSIAIVKRAPGSGQFQTLMLSYGKTSKKDGQDVTPDTEYEIGSITKVFTGILLAQHVKSGAMRLDDPLQNYLPEGINAPAYNNVAITLHDLATHRSGLPRDIDTDSADGMYSWLNSYALPRAPGSKYEYSNVGYSLLGDILARMAGTDFNSLEYQSISQPLGLTDTIETLTAEQSSRRAQGYTYDGSPAQDMPESGAFSSAGYMRSTLRDMAQFLIDNMQPEATPLAESIEMTQEVQAEGEEPDTGVGLGWEIDQPGTANERIYKGGKTYGFTSYVSFMQDGSSGFVLLTNGMYADTLAPRVLRILSSTP